VATVNRRSDSSHDIENAMVAEAIEKMEPRVDNTADRGPARGDVIMAGTKKQAQALAIKLSRERRAGKKVPPPPKGRYSNKSRQKALRDLKVGRQRRAAKKGRTKKR
jgi:hypothetical protein